MSLFGIIINAHFSYLWRKEKRGARDGSILNGGL